MTKTQTTPTNEIAALGNIGFTDHLQDQKDNPRPKTKYAPSLRLAVKGKLVEKQGIKAGNYALVAKDGVTDLGDSVDVIVLTYLDKALETGKTTKAAFGKGNPEYQRIAARLKQGGFKSGCMVGPCFFLYVPVIDQCVELFCNGASFQGEANLWLYDALPVGPDQAKLHGVETKGPDKLTFGSKYLEGDNVEFVRWVPEFSECTTVFEKQPPIEEILEAVKTFTKQGELEADARKR